MNMMEALRVWRRRWILTGVLLLLAFVATGAAVMKLPRTYLAESTVTLLPSISSSQDCRREPLPELQRLAALDCPDRRLPGVGSTYGTGPHRPGLYAELRCWARAEHDGTSSTGHGHRQ